MEEMPELDIDVITVILHRQTGQVEVNHDGMNYLEAIGVMTVALHKVEDDNHPIYTDWSDDDEDDA